MIGGTFIACGVMGAVATITGTAIGKLICLFLD